MLLFSRSGHDSFEDARASLELVLYKVKGEVASTVKNSNAAAFPSPSPLPPFGTPAAAVATPAAAAVPLKLSAVIGPSGDIQQNNNNKTNKWFLDKSN